MGTGKCRGGEEDDQANWCSGGRCGSAWIYGIMCGLFLVYTFWSSGLIQHSQAGVPHPQHRIPPLLFQAILRALGKVSEHWPFLKNFWVHIEHLHTDPLLIKMPYLFLQFFCFTAPIMPVIVGGQLSTHSRLPVSLAASAQRVKANCTGHCLPCSCSSRVAQF